MNLIESSFRARLGFFLAFLLNFVSSSVGINASVDLRIVGNGFHRSLEYRINTGDFVRENCYVALYLELPSILYVDADELADLRRRGKSLVCSVGEIDVELFADKAEPQNVTACAALDAAGSVLTIPLHQRYRYAKENGGYVNVTLPDPKILVGCKTRIKEHRVSKIDLCAPCVELVSKWRQIPFALETEKYVWRVPVGNASRLHLVTYVTLFFTCLGAAYTLRVILQAREDGHRKND